MYQVDVEEGAAIRVQARAKSMDFATDSSAMNPLEGFYAALAGCAAVYVKKACKELRLPARGIHIRCRPHAGRAGALSLERFETALSFPPEFPAEHRPAVLDAVSHCAVKELVQQGAGVEFVVREG
ncbi:OsmC family protein [Azohydromonas aeria]|uniref:OsmC family protein n=1 Tax=Azohydromonas aeria TaxID=2590212 RepID=UPI0012F872AD|nr:OsmC family protein [Azohydromonas aeria]